MTPTAHAYVKRVPTKESFKIARNAQIVAVYKGGQKLRLRCAGDGCDFLLRGRKLADVNDLDRRFRNVSRFTLKVRLRTIR